MRRAIAKGRSVVIQEETETAGAWTCGAPIEAVTEHGVFCCNDHATMLHDRGFKLLTVSGIGNVLPQYISKR